MNNQKPTNQPEQAHTHALILVFAYKMRKWILVAHPETVFNVIHGYTISFAYACHQIVQNVREGERIELGSSAFCLLALAWLTTYYIVDVDDETKWNDVHSSCHKLIFDTHYLMRELLHMAEQSAKQCHYGLIAIRTASQSIVPNIEFKRKRSLKTPFEMMTYQLAFAYKICII